MSPRRARLLARRRTLVLVCLVALVWCQMVVAATASSMVVAQSAADQVAAQMGLMADCDGADGGERPSGTSHCPTVEAMPDWSKLSVLHALPMPNVFALVPATQRGFAGPVHYGLPRGRAPPRARLCCWLI